MQEEVEEDLASMASLRRWIAPYAATTPPPPNTVREQWGSMRRRATLIILLGKQKS